MSDQEQKRRSLQDLRKEKAARDAKARRDAKAKKDRKPQDAEEKPAESGKTPSPESGKTPSPEGKQKVLNQNGQGQSNPPKAPEVEAPRRREGSRVVTVDRLDEREEKRFKREDEREEKRFNRDRDEWNRRQLITMRIGDRADWLKNQDDGGFEEARLDLTFDGKRGRAVMSQRGYRDGGSGQVRRTPYDEEINRLLGGGGRDGSSTPDWMPKDTAEKGTRFGAQDFLGRDNRGRSSRFEGGYLSADFRENFISSRLDGLRPGDAGYDQARRRAEGAWGQAVKQYDRQFLQYGQERMKEQSRLDFQKRQKEVMRQRQEAADREKATQAEKDKDLGGRLKARGIEGYDRDAKMKNSVLTNREVEQAVAEAVRNSAAATGVAAQVTVGTGATAISAKGYNLKGGTNTVTRIGDPKTPDKSVIADRTRTMAPKQELAVGSRVGGGVEMNRDRVAQARDVTRRLGASGASALKSDDGTFELLTGEKRIASGGKTQGGRYAGNGTIVFGDQKTFDGAVAQNQQNQQKRRNTV